MDTKVKYENWPAMVKIVTAMSNKKFLIKSPTLPIVLGYILLFFGIAGLIYNYYKSDSSFNNFDFTNVFFTIGGLANIASGYSIKWIASNSSWEERFNHTSSLTSKVIYLLITALLIACIVGIIIL